MQTTRLFAAAASLFALTLVGCSSDSTPTGGGSTTADSGASASDSGSSATGLTALNDCKETDYKDGSTITWDFNATPPSTCLKIKKGATVTFNGAFTTHPLGAKGGDAATPFSGTTTGTTATFTFATAGTFGFFCTNHSTMRGAIAVLP